MLSIQKFKSLILSGNIQFSFGTKSKTEILPPVFQENVRTTTIGKNPQDRTDQIIELFNSKSSIYHIIELQLSFGWVETDI